MTTALIYTTGSKLSGLGHVIRMLTLARALKERGVSIMFCAEHETLGLERIRQAGERVIDFHPFDWSWAERFGGDVCIIDLEGGPPRAMLERARPHFRRLVVIGGSGWLMQDRDAIREFADLFICQTVLPADGDLTGPEVLIIDPAYAGCTPDFAGHILVAFGGTDAHNVTPIAVEALRDAGRKVVVVNGGAEFDGVENVTRPPSLLPYLNGASLYVGALGMTAFEAAAAGAPALLTNWSEDHEATSNALEKLSAAENLGIWDRLDGGELRSKADTLLSDEVLWRIMSQAGKALVDGQGAARVADAVLGTPAVHVGLADSEREAMRETATRWGAGTEMPAGGDG